jgi:prevent-host-death family protein
MPKRASTAKVVPATEFKAHCLALIDRVAAGQGDIVISKRGRPVARLVPIDDGAAQHKPLIGSVTLVDPDDDLFSTGTAWESQTSGQARDRGARPKRGRAPSPRGAR